MNDHLNIARDAAAITGNTITPGTPEAEHLRMRMQQHAHAHPPVPAPARVIAQGGRISLDMKTVGGLAAIVAAAMLGGGVQRLTTSDGDETAKALAPIAELAASQADVVSKNSMAIESIGTRVTALESEEQQQDREIGELMVLQVDALAYLLDAITTLADKENLDMKAPPETLTEGIRKMRMGRTGK